MSIPFQYHQARDSKRFFAGGSNSNCGSNFKYNKQKQKNLEIVAYNFRELNRNVFKINKEQFQVFLLETTKEFIFNISSLDGNNRKLQLSIKFKYLVFENQVITVRLKRNKTIFTCPSFKKKFIKVEMRRIVSKIYPAKLMVTRCGDSLFKILFVSNFRTLLPLIYLLYIYPLHMASRINLQQKRS